MNVEKRLLEMKEQISNARRLVDQAEGKQESVLERLKKVFSVDTIEEAEEKLGELKTKHKSMEEKIEKKMDELERKYVWD